MTSTTKISEVKTAILPTHNTFPFHG